MIFPFARIPEGYIIGMGRNPGEENNATHIYKEVTETDPEDGISRFRSYRPMCIYGWNRSDGTRLSIWRGNMSNKGLCGHCQRRVAKGLPPAEPTHHQTKWL